jgi:hypothetical protein
MAESKTASMSQTAVARPSDSFGPTQTQVEHAQGDEDIPLLLPREEPESESEDDETLQDLAARRSCHLKTEKKKAPKKGPKKMRKKKQNKKKKRRSKQPSVVTHLAPPLAPQMDILQYHQRLSSTAANGASVTLETVVNGCLLPSLTDDQNAFIENAEGVMKKHSDGKSKLMELLWTTLSSDDKLRPFTEMVHPSFGTQDASRSLF